MFDDGRRYASVTADYEPDPLETQTLHRALVASSAACDAFELFRERFGQAQLDLNCCVVQYIYTPLGVTASVGDVTSAVPNFKE